MDVSWDMWTHRNGVLHDDKELGRARAAALPQDIQEVYALGRNDSRAGPSGVFHSANTLSPPQSMSKQPAGCIAYRQ